MTTDGPHPETDHLRLRELARRFPKMFRGAVIPWYTPEGWTKMRAVAGDRDKLHDTFEEFERTNSARITELLAAGQPVEKVAIDVDALIAWCAAERRPLDSSARHMFAAITITGGASQAEQV